MADKIAESNRHEVEFFEPGQLLTINEGDYDEHRDYGPYEVLRRFSNHEVVQAFVEGFEKKDVFGPSTIDLIQFLLAKDYIGEPSVVSVDWRADEHLKALAREHGKA